MISRLGGAVSRQQNPATITNKREKVYKEPGPSKQCELEWGPVESRGEQKGHFQFVIHECPFPEFLPSENNPIFPKDEGEKVTT